VDHDDCAYAGQLLEAHPIRTVGAEAMAQSPVRQRVDDPDQDAAPRADDEHGRVRLDGQGLCPWATPGTCAEMAPVGVVGPREVVMKPLVLVFPSNLFPSLDFSVFESLASSPPSSRATQGRRRPRRASWPALSPARTDPRYELLPDLVLNVSALTMYVKRAKVFHMLLDVSSATSTGGPPQKRTTEVGTLHETTSSSSSLAERRRAPAPPRVKGG
jgi:hypothetical protein